MAATHVAHIDDSAFLATRGREVGKRVRGTGGNNGVLKATAETRGTAAAATETATTTEASAIATTTAGETSAATEATTAKTTTESAAASTGATTSESVFTDLKGTALPVVAIELGNSVASIVGRLESDDTGSLGTTSGIGVHVCADNSALLG